MNLKNFGLAEGRLTKDPVFLNNKDGSRKVKFTLAVHDNYKGKDGKYGTQFVNFDGFIRADKETNGVYDCLHKGDFVKVQYSVRSNNYKDKSGKDVFEQVLFIENLQFSETKAASDARAAKNSSDITEEDDFPF